MILTRIYIENYKSLVNFTLDLQPFTVLLGENGSGKSTVFEVLRKIQALISGESKVDALFLFKDRCRWQTLLKQSFELTFHGGPQEAGTYVYHLMVEHTSNGDKSRVGTETLTFNGQPLFHFENGEAQLYSDRSKAGPKFPFDWSQSGISTIYARPDNTLLTYFKQQVAKMIISQIIPASMYNESGDRGDVQPEKHLENYTGWYRYLSQDQGLVNRLTQKLQQVLPQFDSFRFVPYGAKVLLEAKFSGDSKNIHSYQFNELSDGQKMLIALYTLLEAAQSEGNILCLDEPENFISLPEIQPWLNALYETVSDNQCQTILISHHPEVIDLFSTHARWLERADGYATRVSSLPAETEGELRISEMIARRWLQ